MFKNQSENPIFVNLLLDLTTCSLFCFLLFYRIQYNGLNHFQLNKFSKQIFRKFRISQSIKSKVKESNLTRNLFFTSSGLCFIKLIHDKHTVTCESAKSRATGYADQSRLAKSGEPGFDWKQFFRLLWPEIWSLLGAVSVSSLSHTLEKNIDKKKKIYLS